MAQRDNGAMQLLAPLRLFADAVLPARCAGCGTVTHEDHRFCATCWSGMQWLSEPCCAGCNLPFAFASASGTRCAACLAEPPLHGGIRAAVAYGDTASALVLQLKYGGRLAYAETAAQHMRRLVTPEIELLVPVPLHRMRIWSRGFNQSALLARALARSTGTPCCIDALERVRHTPPLRGKSPRERARTVAGVFRIRTTRTAAIAGRTIGLVDDVYTTGATTNACVRKLLSAGAARVIILCWARVVKSPDGD